VGEDLTCERNRPQTAKVPTLIFPPVTTKIKCMGWIGEFGMKEYGVFTYPANGVFTYYLFSVNIGPNWDCNHSVARQQIRQPKNIVTMDSNGGKK
jgi:hypothetical protein